MRTVDWRLARASARADAGVHGVAWVHRPFESIPGATGGWCDQKARRIVVDAGQPANAQLRILIHETIHALGIGYAEYGRERAEVIVDTATYLVAASVGLDVGGESVPYVAGWGETGALEAVTAFATTIDELARRDRDRSRR